MFRKDSDVQKLFKARKSEIQKQLVEGRLEDNLKTIVNKNEIEKRLSDANERFNIAKEKKKEAKSKHK